MSSAAADDKNKYNIRTTFLDTLNVQNSIPTDLKKLRILQSLSPKSITTLSSLIIDLLI